MNKECERWLASPNTDEATKKELYNIKGSENEIASRFSAPLSFGTAGLRGIMRAGIAGMNSYTVAQATQGLARVVLSADGAANGVAIAYDCRNNSRLFAETAARVLAYNNIKVYLFDSLRPTPELSFAVIYLGCIAGINITASHNPKEYNGYKVYWSDGAQLPPEHADEVSKAMAESDVLDIKKMPLDEAISSGIVTIIGEEIDREYLKNVLDCRINPEIIRAYGNSLSLVYTPLHGTGYRLIPETLKLAGIDNLRVVPEQAEPDGNFPTVESPNPENKPCFRLAFDYIQKNKLSTDVVIATDPDGDRLGVAVKERDGSFSALSGNRIGALLVDYIIKARRAKGTLPENACAIRSVVSSELFDKICRKNGVKPVTVLTGFKYIGEKIKEYAETGEHTFIFGYEESQGFLSGGYVRDKDGVAASLLIAEAASYYKSINKTLFEALEDIYAEYGYHDELTLSVAIKGALPMETMKRKMSDLRSDDIEQINNVPLTVKGDYKAGITVDLKTNVCTRTGLPITDMLYYKTTDGTTVIIRPSGTEPKVKAYILTNGKNKNEISVKLDAYKNAVLKLFN
ncbi:MAG: phospho-sugar mutase [Eubacteriales bacterium]|nr:phospho-sugar mutase [Eubacteriales bacterium]